MKTLTNPKTKKYWPTPITDSLLYSPHTEYQVEHLCRKLERHLNAANALTQSALVFPISNRKNANKTIPCMKCQRVSVLSKTGKTYVCQICGHREAV
jgi:hypothetical protein